MDPLSSLSDWIKLIGIIIASFAGLGLAVAGTGYGFSSFKAGQNKYKDELITDLKATVVQKEVIIKELNDEKSTLITSHQNQLTALQTELNKLKIAFGIQENKLKTYETILENRDPQTLSTLNSIKDGIEKLNSHQIFQEKHAKGVAKKLDVANQSLPETMVTVNKK